MLSLSMKVEPNFKKSELNKLKQIVSIKLDRNSNKNHTQT